MTDFEAERYYQGVLHPNERVLLRVPRPSRTDNLKTLRVTAIIAALGVAIALFAHYSSGDGSWILAVIGLFIGPYLFALWLRSAKTHFVLTNQRTLRFVGNTVSDDFGWEDSERPMLLERGKPVSDAVIAMERKMSSAPNVLLRLRTNRPISWKICLLGGDRRSMPVPNRSEGPTALEVLEASQRAWEAAQ